MQELLLGGEIPLLTKTKFKEVPLPLTLAVTFVESFALGCGHLWVYAER